MAKAKEEAPAAATAETAQAAEPKVNKRTVMVEDPRTGDQIGQKELLRQVYAEGKMRRNELRDWYNENVATKQGKAPIPYQSVRAAVNDMGWNQADKDYQAKQEQARIDKAAKAAENAQKRKERAEAQAAAAKAATEEAAAKAS